MVNGIGLTNSPKSLPKGAICALIVSDAVTLNASPRRCRSGRVDSARTGSIVATQNARYSPAALISGAILLSGLSFNVAHCTTAVTLGSKPGGSWTKRSLPSDTTQLGRFSIAGPQSSGLIYASTPRDVGVGIPPTFLIFMDETRTLHPGSMIPSCFTAASWNSRRFRLKIRSYFKEISPSRTAKWNAPSSPSWPGGAGRPSLPSLPSGPLLPPGFVCQYSLSPTMYLYVYDEPPSPPRPPRPDKEVDFRHRIG